MVELGSGARLAQEPGAGGRVFGYFARDDLQRHLGFQHGVAGAVRRGGGTRAEFDRSTIRADDHLEVPVTQGGRVRQTLIRGRIGPEIIPR